MLITDLFYHFFVSLDKTDDGFSVVLWDVFSLIFKPFFFYFLFFLFDTTFILRMSFLLSNSPVLFVERVIKDNLRQYRLRMIGYDGWIFLLPFDDFVHNAVLIFSGEEIV